VCQSHPVPSLVETIQRRHRISKSSVISEITKKAQDPDIVATSQVLSLKCPLTYMRLDLPVRSMACRHIQCFDATSYLQLQEQGPQWLCPICQNAAPFDHLAVDEYVKDILANTSKSQEQVTIEPGGRWHVLDTVNDDEETKSEDNDVGYVDDDDDALIISDLSFLSGRSTATPSWQSHAFGTPNMSAQQGASREGSSMPKSSSGSNKRSIAQVIDLTLSDDDDEPPDPPPKRQNVGVANGYSEGSLDRFA